MTNRQIKQYRMLARIRDFGATHGKRLPEASLATAAFASIGEVVTQLSEHAIAQLALKRKGAKARAAARAALMEMLGLISRTARMIQIEDPSFPNTFLIPERQSAPAVITTAQLFARDVTPFVEKFVAHAMPSMFPDELKRLLESYEQAVRLGEVGLGQSAAARVSIETAMATGLTEAHKLDVIIANHLRGDLTTVAEWERARRVGYRKSKAPAAPEAAAEPTNATPVASPTTEAGAQHEGPAASPAPVPSPTDPDVPDASDVPDVEAA